MYSKSILAVSGLLSLVAAIPMAHEHHHQPHQKRDYVWVTETEEAVVTVPVTQTVWLEPGETAPVDNLQQNRPVFTSHIQQTVTMPHPSPEAASSSSSEAPAPYVAPTPSSSSAAPYVAPTPSSSSSVYVAPPAPTTTSSTSVYVAPPAPTTSSTTSVYVAPPAPTTSSTSQYVAPPAPTTQAAPPAYSAPASSSAPAPASSSAAPAPASGGGAGNAVQAISNSVTGMAAAGTSFTGQLTNYAVGMGSCGIVSTETQDVVAVSHVIMSVYNGGNPNTNPLCGKTVGIKGVDGQTYHATIVDTCPGCDEGSLDLPLKFFNTVTGNADGVGRGIEWSFD